MDPWIPSEIRMRRDDALRIARDRGLERRSQRGRRVGFRIRIAAAAQIASDALGALARSLRNGETA